MVSKQADADLLHAWREGDRVAGSELFRRHFASVQRFFRNAVEPDALDDLVQSTFVTCVEARDRFEGRSSFRTYLFGVAHNVLRAHYRRRRQRASEVDFEVTSVADLGLGPSTLLGCKRERRALIEALRQIPLDSQILLQLRYWERLRTAELAEVLGVPRGTAVDRLRRAQAQLEHALARVEASPRPLDSTLASIGSWAASVRLDPSECDPQLAVVIPQRLGDRRLVGRARARGLERARYRGGNAEIELSVRRLDPDVHVDTWDREAQALAWEAVVVGRRRAWLRWRTEPRREAEVRVRVGRVMVELRLTPAARPEAAVELMARLTLDQLEARV